MAKGPGGIAASLPNAAHDDVAFRSAQVRQLPQMYISGRTHQPAPSLSTLRRRGHPRQRKTRYRSAGLSLDRAGLSPARHQSLISEFHRFSFLQGQACPGAPCASTATRLPRSRGDGPIARLAILYWRVAPPLTRGWSLDTEGSDDCDSGSPAHAGMVPVTPRQAAAKMRLPRSRGDGPPPFSRLGAFVSAPPLTRGWSPPLSLEWLVLDGSPAHAGMVPGPTCGSLPPAWLPRSRGDGPWSRPDFRGTRWAPPLTRGWSPHHEARASRPVGSPAHAGMVPPPAAKYHAPRWLPRSRGDGPPAWIETLMGFPAPPLTRGWSHYKRRGTSIPGGSPAHAGMVPV